jgi:hypothetical protein
VQALALNGTLLNNMPVLVKPSEAEKVGCITRWMWVAQSWMTRIVLLNQTWFGSAECMQGVHSRRAPARQGAWSQLALLPTLQNMAWEAEQQAKANQASATQLLNKMGGTAPGAKTNPIKLQVRMKRATPAVWLRLWG